MATSLSCRGPGDRRLRISSSFLSARCRGQPRFAVEAARRGHLAAQVPVLAPPSSRGATISGEPPDQRRGAAHGHQLWQAAGSCSLRRAAAGGLLLRSPLRTSRFDFGRTTTNIAAELASSAAFIAVTEWNTCDGFFARATTRKAGGHSLSVALRAQCFLWHCSPPSRPFCATLNRAWRSRLSRHDQQPQLPASSMDGVVNDHDYNDGAQNHHPIGKLNARYRCPFAKPFHDYPSHTQTAARPLFQ